MRKGWAEAGPFLTQMKGKNMFLPVTKKEIEERGWEQVDFVLVTGDAYVDHHSFGTAIIGRILEKNGYKVAVLPQPNYQNAEDFKIAPIEIALQFLLRPMYVMPLK